LTAEAAGLWGDVKFLKVDATVSKKWELPEGFNLEVMGAAVREYVYNGDTIRQ
jgi:hypothetical protein